MAITNWPPAPGSVLAGQSISWPPPGYFKMEWSTIPLAQQGVRDLGWDWRNPNNNENNAYFDLPRCGNGHRVDGVMLIDTRPGGLIYPIGCMCRGQEQEAGALWPPFHIGSIG